MTRKEPSDLTATHREARTANTHRLCLLVIGDGFFATHPLPGRGLVTIGRLGTCDLRIELPAISREHARLEIGDTMRLQDLGSANGTRVRGQALEPNEVTEILPGDLIELGRTMVIVQHFAESYPARRIWTHNYFEWRLQDECERSGRTGASFALARIHLVRATSERYLGELILEALRPGDHVAEYGPQDFELLLPDTSTEIGERVMSELGTRLESSGATVAMGVAYYGRDGRTPEALMERACAALLPDPDYPDSANPVLIETGVMNRLHRMVERIAQGDINVVILGETGAGKEVLAQKIHSLSPRARKPMVAINCAALSETLLESELFGHERGAFTGAVAAKAGLLEAAEGGTVFLDEMGDLPLVLQAKLLRVIEERKLRRVGGVASHDIDVRFLAATHRDLESEVEKGTFRQDLYFRLNGITIVVPPLRDRPDEIEPLARMFITKACARTDRPEPDLTPEAVAVLLGFHWPGNVRELRNVIERAVLLCGDGPITPKHLPVEKPRVATLPISRPVAITQPPPMAEDPPGWTDIRANLESHEKKLLIDALHHCNGNQTQAAKLLGISRRTILNRIAAYGLPRPRKDKSSLEE